MKQETITRFYVERNAHFQEENEALKATIERDLGIELRSVRIVHRYYITDVEAIKRDPRFRAILAQPQSDLLFEKFISYAPEAWVLARESLPGQYDQRADSLAQSIEVITGKRPLVQVATLFIFDGVLTPEMKGRITDYLINPIDSRVAHLDKPTSLAVPEMPLEAVPTIKGLMKADEEGLKAIKTEWGLSCDLADLKEIQRYFRDIEKRDPTLTECRVLDTYWSDHCRHTTFNTALTLEACHDPRVSAAFERYLSYRQALYSPEKLARKPISLMDMATIAAKRLIRDGVVKHVDQSEEINACCVKTTLQTSEGPQDWLYYFKNETHNHPTEIEPFGGAATCLGGAIRDPLSGRAYVYQGCRVTGAANPLVDVKDTRPGKRSQRQICQLAAKGFASYGNQIGMATGLVDEVYHPGYEAKRMEVGAVVGAAPACNVVRETPRPGDWVVLVGGRTGRDGCGGATGSSQTHNASTIETAGAQVQKGNAVEERKLQRLFRDPELAPKIIRCNDFGAGGIAVSVGELADGVEIYLDRMPKKYMGLNPTELAISESQERMSCVIHPESWECFKAKADAENLEATVVARITEAPVLVMRYGDETLVHLERSFLESAGAPKRQTVIVDEPKVAGPRPYEKSGSSFQARVKALMTGLNHCSKKGLIENFDSTIGSNTVLMPLGGKTQSTPTQVMASKFPLLKGETQACSVFTYGFDPYETETDPYQGSYDALVLSVMKLIAAGVPPSEVYLSLQEYFPSLKGDAHRWGRPLAAILGAMDAQCDLGAPAIGGKDSMSGSYETLDVPATLISFATAITTAPELLSGELKGAGHKLVRVDMPLTKEGRLDTEGFKRVWASITEAKRAGTCLSGWALTSGGLIEGLLKMAFGNDVGVALSPTLTEAELFSGRRGALVFEMTEPLAIAEATVVGETIEAPLLTWGEHRLSLFDVKEAWDEVLEVVYPREATSRQGLLASRVPMVNFKDRPKARSAGFLTHRPKAVIAVFPGTNCEVDTARALTRAGADVETVIIANQTPAQLLGSVDRLEAALSSANMMVLPGGFSFGDEPDGSGKFIATFLRNERLAIEIEAMLYDRDGLMLGICNGFQALVKLGLLPSGHITQGNDTMPTLTFNRIGRHHSGYVQTRISSVYSPWLMGVNCGDIHSIAVSHGEGRLAASNPKVIESLLNAGQVATQYVDPEGYATMAFPFNPNGSTLAVEGLISPDGRILGKMGHSERRGSYVAMNIPGEKDQQLFESGVAYFSGKHMG